MTEAQYIEKARLIFKHNDIDSLKKAIVFTEDFVEPFRFFRDEWLQHPRKTSKGRGPGLTQTAARVATEFEKGVSSRYCHKGTRKMKISDWKDVDFYVHFILSVIYNFQANETPLHASQEPDEIERIAQGIHLLLSAAISWYNPNRRGPMYKRLEEMLNGTEPAAPAPKPALGTGPFNPVSAIMKGHQLAVFGGGFFGYINLLDGVVSPAEGVTPPDADPAERSLPEGRTEDVGLGENEEVQATSSTPSKSQSTTPSDRPAPKRPRTRAELLEKINTEKAKFDSLVQEFEDSDTVGEAVQYEAVSKYSYLQDLCVEYRNHWGIDDAPEPPEFPEKFTLKLEF